MRRYTFRALVSAAVAAGDAGTREYRGETPACAMRTSRLVQPGYHHYLPALISRDEESLPHSQDQVVVTVTLADGEAETLFAPGHRFTIWADGLIGRTVRPDGLVGHGVISRRAPPSPLPQGGRTPGRAAVPARRRRPASRPGPGINDRDQRPAV